MRGAERAGLPTLPTFGGTPAWASPDGSKAPYDDGSRASPPADLADWDRFVRAAVTRYRHRIGAYELWSFAPSPRYFTGDAVTLADMPRRAGSIIERVDPEATIVCPSFGELWEERSRRFLREFAAAGGYQNCDVAGVELHQRSFTDKPETMIDLAGLIDRAFHAAGVHLRLWSTGTTYRIATADPLSQGQAENYAVRFYLVGLYARYDRMYFYNWGGNRLPIVLQAEGGPPTRPALYIEELQRWLTGARIYSCGHGVADNLPDNVWQCRFHLPARRGGGQAAIRWTDAGTATMTAEASARAVLFLDGGRRDIRPGDPVHITGQPRLVEYARQE